jgi:hypothetical protein
MAQILASGSFISHEIDFKSHGETYEWNGHWAISDKKWEIIRGTRPYLINREPLSTHLNLLKSNDFMIVKKEICSGIMEEIPSISREKLAEKFLYLSDEDFNTASCFIICKKI